jgi:hypothetical protein
VTLEPKIDLARQDEQLRRGITMPMAPLPLDDQSEPIPVFEWDVVNQSKGGLRVRRIGRTEQPIAGGRDRGHQAAGKAHWAIGAVRWVTVFEDGGHGVRPAVPAPHGARRDRGRVGRALGPGLLIGGRPGQADLITSPNAFSHLQRDRARRPRRLGGGAARRRGRGDPPLRALHVKAPVAPPGIQKGWRVMTRVSVRPNAVDAEDRVTFGTERNVAVPTFVATTCEGSNAPASSARASCRCRPRASALVRHD